MNVIRTSVFALTDAILKSMKSINLQPRPPC